MFLIDETNIGPAVVYCAPKTGCTSLTAIARDHGYSHLNEKHWHVFGREHANNRAIILTVRDPRDRLMSLWTHFRGEVMDISLDSFLRMQIHCDVAEFFRFCLCDWYRGLIGLPIETVRLETFQQDLNRLFGWQEVRHENKTRHCNWKEYREIVEPYVHWWQDDALAFGYEPC